MYKTIYYIQNKQIYQNQLTCVTNKNITNNVKY